MMSRIMKPLLPRPFSCKTVFLSAACILTGFATAVHAQKAGRRMAVTFDDLPAMGRADDLSRMIEINRRLLEILKTGKIPATGFVNEGKLFVIGEIDRRTQILREWLDGGHDLGNHSFSHITINDTPF